MARSVDARRHARLHKQSKNRSHILWPRRSSAARNRTAVRVGIPEVTCDAADADDDDKAGELAAVAGCEYHHRRGGDQFGGEAHVQRNRRVARLGTRK